MDTKLTAAQLDALKRQARIELARRDFWEYCKLRAPDFYKENRAYLKHICLELEDFYYSDDKVMIINEPPRHGKTRTAGLFAEWIFGKNPREKIITGAYNEQLSTTFSRNVRDGISERKGDKNRVVYSEIFPKTKIKRGSGAANMWSLEGSHVSYLATSPGGTVTGFGATLMIIDDIVKNAEEAYNETVLESHWAWFCFTGDTLVKTINGDKPIKDIGIGDKVLTFNHSQCIIEEKEVVRVDSHLNSIYRLEFENGQEIECTGNHRFYTNRGYLSIEQILSAMRCSVKEGQTVLFSDLQKQSESWESDYDNVPELRKRNSVGKEESSDEILFYRLQEQVSSETGDEPLCWMGEIEGQIEERTSSMSTMWNNRTSSSTSYRPQHKKQSIRQFDCTVPIVPFKLSQITRVPSTDVRRVYDIEIKDNHNFFANNILVHNCNTMLSRLEKGGKVIIIATRWHSDDLSGRALAHYKSIGVPVRLILETALQPDGTMLCDEVLDRASYDLIVKTMGKDIAEANYNQRPIDERNKLYTEGFKTYNQIPQDENGNSLFEVICSYCDVADRGTDYLCNIIYGVYNKQAYVLDVYYTTDGMEVTEPETAKRLYDYGVQRAFIESNNGGRGFGRSVERILRDKYHTHKCMIELFYQSKNKTARILGASTWVQHNVIFPVGWEINYEEFFTHIYKFQRDVKGNKHDDCVDALSGVYEKLGRGNLYSFD